MVPLHFLVTLDCCENQHDTDLRAAEGSKNEAEARCKVLRDTIDRLEGDLATLTAQVSTWCPRRPTFMAAEPAFHSSVCVGFVGMNAVELGMLSSMSWARKTLVAGYSTSGGAQVAANVTEPHVKLLCSTDDTVLYRR